MLAAALLGSAAAAKHSYADGDNVKLWANVRLCVICLVAACLHPNRPLMLYWCCIGGWTIQ